MERVRNLVQRIASELEPLEKKMHELEQQKDTGMIRADLATEISRRQIRLRKLTKRLVLLENTTKNKHAGTRRRGTRKTRRHH
jgi:hypothetical protein